MVCFGVDLGGTNIKAAVVDDQGQILAEQSRPTALPRSADSIAGDIAEMLQHWRDTRPDCAEVGGVGVGCPGSIEAATGRVVYSNNLKWADYPLGEKLHEKLNLPVTVGNDANVAALGEAVAGCAKGARNAIILTLGTGVGGGILVDGKLLTGATGMASEPGHMVIDRNGPLCTCGRRGCLEVFGSATALIRMTRDKIARCPDSGLARLAVEDGKVTGRTAFDALRAGDAAGTAVVQEYIHRLATGVANLVNIFSPEVIGFSGGIAKEGETLLAPLRKEVEAGIFGHEFAQPVVRLVACQLGYRAGVIGAATLIRQQLS